MTNIFHLIFLVKLAKLVGCEENETNNSTTVECLQNKESKELLKKEYEVEEYTINFFPFVPTVDQNFLPASPKKMMRHGTIDPSVDVLIGNNANEGFWSLMYYLPDLMPNKELNDSQKILDDAEYHKYVHDIFNFHPKRVSSFHLHVHVFISLIFICQSRFPLASFHLSFDRYKTL